MEKRSLLENHNAGISIIAFVVAVAISMGYYQFVFVPQANEKPVLPHEKSGIEYSHIQRRAFQAGNSRRIDRIH